MQKFLSTQLYGICLLLCFILFSCSNNKKNDEIIKQMEESIISSNRTINFSTEQILRELENKTTEPVTMERAKVWLQKAEQITVLTSELYALLEANKENLNNGKVNFDYFEDKLYKYKQNILNIDSTIRVEFENNTEFINKTSPSSLEGLTLMQNNIKIIENKITAYCDTKTGYLDGPGFFTSFSVIVGQNSNYLKPGDILEIKAGIGSFSRAAQPKITFDGKEIDLGEEGYSIYKIKTPKTPGNYKIPVVFNFFNQETGKDEARQVNVEYTIVKPCDQ